MAVSIKSEKEIELMRVSCKNLSVMFDEMIDRSDKLVAGP